MKRSWKLLRELFLFSTKININASNVDVIQKQWMLFIYFGSLWIRGNLKFLSSLPLTIFRVAVENAKILSQTHISAWNFKLKLEWRRFYKKFFTSFITAAFIISLIFVWLRCHDFYVRNITTYGENVESQSYKLSTTLAPRRVNVHNHLFIDK